MKAKVTPHYIQLVFDACLKSFWRKRSLARFLESCGVPHRYIATWAPDETKRELLDRLFADLPKSQDGKRLIVRMAGSLIEQKSFPDLENWEDSTVKITDAEQALDRLKDHQRKQDEDLRKEREAREAQAKFREEQVRVVRQHMTLHKLGDCLDDLTRQLGSQRAGYRFQDWFYSLADFAEVENKRPYVSSGRQIDGSVTVLGTTYLIELKFTRKPAGCPDIDSFYMKVTSKADNTMGVMLSVSGYTSTAKGQASGRRTPLLLLDYSHLQLILRGGMTLQEVIDRVRRHSSQTAEAYLAATDFGR